MRVSDYIANYLEDMGVECVFMLAGGGMMHLIDAIGRKEKLKYFCNHHEQAGTMAADGYARQSGKMGVSYATSGPGGTNTLTGIVGAYQDSIPMLVITGQSKVSQTMRGTGQLGLRQFGVFEVDILPMVQSVTKYAAFVDDPNMIGYHLQKACYLAQTGRPGPVLLDIPLNIQGAPIEEKNLKAFDPAELGEQNLPQVKPQILEVLEGLKKAERPLLLLGHGVRCSGQTDEVVSLVEKWGVPTVTTSLGTDILPFENKNFVGHPGVKGDRPGNFAIQSADFILSVGASLHVTTTGYEMDLFAPGAKKALIDPDPAVLEREEVGVDFKIPGRVQDFVAVGKEFSMDWAKGSKVGEWAKACQSWKSDLSVQNEVHEYAGEEINYYDVIDAIGENSAEGDTIVADAGSAFYVAGQALRVKKGQRVLNSGSLGAMGFAVPATTGACLASNSSRVICLTGEGSLQTNVHELGTISKNKLNAKLVIVTNGGYVSIRNTQNSFFDGFLVGTDEASGVEFPNLEDLAKAYKLPFVQISSKENLSSELAQVFATDGPILCEILASEQQKILPTVTSQKLADGSMKSRPLHEMAPFLSEEVMNKYLPKEWLS